MAQPRNARGQFRARTANEKFAAATPGCSRHSPWEPVGLAGLIVGLVALVASIWQGVISQTALRDQQISSAWQILAIPGGGSTGKSYALSNLVTMTSRLNGLDLGCPTDPVQGLIDLVCPDAVDLQDIILAPKETVFIGRSNFTYAQMTRAILADLEFMDANFERSAMDGVRTSNVSFTFARFDRASLFNATFSGGEFVGASFRNTNLRDVRFDGLALNSVDFVNAQFSRRTVFNDVSFSAIDISGLELCQTDPGYPDGRAVTGRGPDGNLYPLQGWVWAGCPELPEAFWKAAYFSVANPPKQLYAYESAVLRAGCPPIQDDPDRANIAICPDNFLSTLEITRPVNLVQEQLLHDEMTGRE